MIRPIDRRLKFSHFVDRIFWALLTASVVYAASELKTVSTSVEELNIKMGVVVEKISNAEKRVDSQDRKIERIEEQLRSKSIVQ